MLVVPLESLEGLQIFWLDRMMDYPSFRSVVLSRFGAEPDEIAVADSTKDDPRLLKLRVPPERVEEFNEFFQPYDVSGRPPMPIQQVISFDS